MKLNEFIAGQYKQGYQYQYFLPNVINDEFTWDSIELNALLSEASYHIGELNALSQFVPDVNLFIKMHVAKEAVVSSKIEGTRTNLQEALMNKEDIAPEARDDWQEVNNYIIAMNYALARLENLPISNRLLTETHQLLLNSVRGQHKAPGEFRKSQNWIGGATLKDATFIPPIETEVADLMADLEKFIHNQTIHVPDLIKIAIIHYQFETIHPFLDGNGRLGRLLITLFLVQRGLLSQPLLYLSDFFEQNRQHYFEKLMRVRTSNDLEGWLKFFLIAVIETSKKATKTLKQVIDLKNQVIEYFISEQGRRSQKAQVLLKHLFSEPTLQIKQVQKICGLSARSAGILVSAFVEAGFLKETTGYQRNRMFQFQKYLDCFDRLG